MTEQPQYRIYVTTSDGKYTVRQPIDGRTEVLRYGEPWPAYEGKLPSNLELALAYDLAETREFFDGKVIYVQFSDNGEFIRKWSRTPFEGGNPFRCAPLKAVETIPAIRDVVAERERQVEEEGWTLDHDDRHNCGELARAAACYAFHAGSKFAWPAESYASSNIPFHHPEHDETSWPWDLDWWKPKDPRCDLVRAAALIVAEIERIDRAAAVAVTFAPPEPGALVGGKAFRP